MRKLLFVGDDWYGSNATSLRDGLIANGVEVATVNTTPDRSGLKRLGRKSIVSISTPYYDRLRSRYVSSQVLTALASDNFFAVVVFKGNHVSAEALANITIPTVHYHPDDSSNEYNTSVVYREAESLYDIHITTKSHNVSELQERTNSEVVFMMCAYDHRWHYRAWSTFRSTVGFVGTCRPGRRQFVERVSSKLDQELLVAGTGWSRSIQGVRILPPQYGTQFARFVAEAPIQLGMLNSANRDTHTCRSFEVPASGGLFLGEDTDQHRSMFTSGKTGFLYTSAAEALELATYLAKSPTVAEKVALAGERSLRTSGNSYVARAAAILNLIG